jgi:D-glycerate 3-kinase
MRLYNFYPITCHYNNIMRSVSDISIEFILKHLSLSKKRPLLCAVNGPQGSGKSVLTRNLVQSLQSHPHNLKAVGFSIDDFYLTRKEQIELASMTRNPLLAQRGLPGTHDVKLAKKVIQQLLDDAPEVRIPRYDKSMHLGEGDRTPDDVWQCVEPQPVDVIIFEGWFLGFTHLTNASVTDMFNSGHYKNMNKWKLDDLLEVNNNLIEYERLYLMFDCFIRLVAEDISFVTTWRWQQEETMRNDANNQSIGFNRTQVDKFVSKFMPLYEMYLPRLAETSMPNQLLIHIDIKRRVVKVH